MSKIIDGHIHVTRELLPYLQGVRCIANADSPEEYRFLKYASVPGMVISAGIHPWKADITSWEEMVPVLTEAAVMGEIGLDSAWCSVDMEVQRLMFRRQLELASVLRTPVVLHTKGMEREILDTIRQYPNRYLVHWYACGDWLREYIDYGCWFTVGPDVAVDQAVEHLAETVPLDRLLIESDGIDGIAWGQGVTLSPAEYPNAMERHLRTVASLRGVRVSALAEQMEHSFEAFLQC